MIGERFRRGKLQKAREGHFIGGKAPYGYRYIPKRDGVPGHLVIDETEAEMIRMLFSWLVEERMTIRQITKRLNEGSWYPRSGKHPWSPSTVQSILSHPIHAGTTYANRYRYVAPEKPKGRGPRSGENTCRVERPREEWIPIPAPAIVDEDTHRRAQVQLERNAELSFRNNKKYSYLLRCLLTCESCGLAMHGVTNRSLHQATRRYYQCAGKNPISTAREHKCLQTSAKIEELDAAVWDHVKELMRDPKRLLEQFENYANLASEGEEKERTEAKALEAHLKRLTREEARLIDAYQTEIINLQELKERRQKVAERRKAITDQHEQQARLRRQTAQAREVLKDLQAFCERISTRIEEATFEEKQSILQLLIERIIVGEDTLEIRHVIPLDGPLGNSKDPLRPPTLRLRPDGVHPIALDSGLREDVAQGAPEAQSTVSHRQLRWAHSPLFEVSQ
jgi:site-specific DNA recombinase